MVSKKLSIAVVCLTLVLFCGIGGTLAYIVTNTDPLTNVFQKTEVTCEVLENFEGKTKRNVNVQNTGDIDAYIRVKLISYRVNSDGDHIGGKAEIPTFTPGEGWIYDKGYYYYTKPVAPEAMPEVDLIGDDGITLKEYALDYTETSRDVDGGKQVIEVMAEAIQSKPMTAVKDAWGDAIASQLQPTSSEQSESTEPAEEIIIE